MGRTWVESMMCSQRFNEVLVMLETSLIRWVGRRLEVNDLLLHHSTLTKKSDMSYNQPIFAIRSMQTIFSITEIQLQLLTAISFALWMKVKHQNIFFVVWILKLESKPKTDNVYYKRLYGKTTKLRVQNTCNLYKIFNSSSFASFFSAL